VIAATDSSGGAGLTRDVRVLTDFSVDALCVVTAVTAQSDHRVTAVHPVPPEIIRVQIAAAFETRAIAAVKVGMLGTAASIDAVVEGLSAGLAGSPSGVPPGGGEPGAVVEIAPRGPREQAGASVPIVVDPVLVSTSGGVLLDQPGRAALLNRLLPLATLVTPNIPEAAALLGEAVATGEAELVAQGRRLLHKGAGAILLKGGHARGKDAIDLLIRSGEATVEKLSQPRTAGTCRGTGCALASAIAASLARGKSLPEACRDAKSYVLQMLARSA
jgi:hydroxymethylpyrimidine/phosphomethylpyrimidine kinase